MKKKYLSEFIALFQYLDDAAGIIEDNYNPSDIPNDHREGYERLKNLQSKKIKETYNRIIEIRANTNSGFMADLTNEIETNLYEHKDSQGIYIKAIIRQFTDIIPFFDIPNIPEIRDLSFDWGKDSIKIGNKTYGRGMNYIFKTLVESSKFVRENFTIEECYIISSKDLLRVFCVFLDAKCLDFDIDIIHFQEELNIYLFKNRNTAHRIWLYDLGYREKLNQISVAPTDTSQNLRELNIQKEDASSENDNQSTNLPKELNTEIAQSLLCIAVKAGLLNKNYTPTDKTRTKAQKALLAEIISEKANIQNKWKPFESLWGVSGLAQQRYDSKEKVGKVRGGDIIESAFV